MGNHLHYALKSLENIAYIDLYEQFKYAIYIS